MGLHGFMKHSPSVIPSVKLVDLEIYWMKKLIAGSARYTVSTVKPTSWVKRCRFRLKNWSVSSTCNTDTVGSTGMLLHCVLVSAQHWALNFITGGYKYSHHSAHEKACSGFLTSSKSNCIPSLSGPRALRVHTELNKSNLHVGSSICSEWSAKAPKLQTLVTVNYIKPYSWVASRNEMGTFLFSVMCCFQKIVIMNCCQTFFSNVFFIPLLCVMAQRRFVEHELGSLCRQNRLDQDILSKLAR